MVYHHFSPLFGEYVLHFSVFFGFVQPPKKQNLRHPGGGNFKLCVEMSFLGEMIQFDGPFFFVISGVAKRLGAPGSVFCWIFFSDSKFFGKQTGEIQRHQRSQCGCFQKIWVTPKWMVKIMENPF